MLGHAESWVAIVFLCVMGGFKNITCGILELRARYVDEVGCRTFHPMNI